MKKLLTLIVIITTSILFSCSSSSDSSSASSDVLLTKIIYDDGSSSNLEYAGNKLIKVSTSDGGYTIFTYTGDLVTREDNYSSNKTITEHYEYYYTGNNLIQVKYFIGNTLSKKYSFLINTDNTITRTRTNYSGTNTTSTVYKEYYINEEKVKEEVLNSSGSIVYTITFLYDDKNCPYKNITGFRYLNGWFDDNSPFHNVIKRSYSNSSFNTQNYSYQYNSDGYPTVSSCTSGGITDSSQLFY